jgi:predicted acetyltransferase
MLELRPITATEVDAFIEVMAGAFYERRDPWHDAWFRKQVPLESTIAALDDGAIVGTSAALPLTLSVPGGRCAAAGITAVGVQPTHRRRGLLRAMMDRQLRDARAANTPVAILWASEGSIYGRFGFGPATRRLGVVCERPNTALIDTPSAGPLRMMDRPEALQLMPAVYDQLVSDRPGLLIRDRTMWDAVGADDDPHLPASEARHYFLIHGDPPDGYAIYRMRRSETHDGQRATALVVELTALGPVAEADLWRHLLALDLVGRVERRMGPIDDPVLWLAQDPQALQVQWKTGIWARLLDVPTALQTRRYQAGGVLVLDVSDPFLPEVGGRFHLQVRDGIGKCVETDDEPDLRLGISELSSAFLGQICFGALSRAGRIMEVSPGAAIRADRLFGWDPPPWCVDEF